MDVYFTLRQNRDILASAGLTTANVKVGEHMFEVVGIGDVIVAPGHRGHGHAHAVIGDRGDPRTRP